MMWRRAEQGRDRLSIPTIRRSEDRRSIEVEDPRDMHVCYGTYTGLGLKTIIDTALTRDRFMRMHLLAVNKMAYILADQIGLDTAGRELLTRAALLHDVGKILVPDRIVQKPSKLTAEEYAVIKTHADLGARLIATEPGFDEVATLIAQHHEWYDGGGYPMGLTHKQTHPLSGVLSVIDAYSAMTDERPYSAGKTGEEALAELQRCAGTQFDPHYVEAFSKMKQSRATRTV